MNYDVQFWCQWYGTIITYCSVEARERCGREGERAFEGGAGGGEEWEGGGQGRDRGTEGQSCQPQSPGYEQDGECVATVIHYLACCR